MNIVGSRPLGLIVIGAVLYWSAVILTMHVLEPEFSTIRAPMSAYVLGAYGPWMTTTYFALCAALLGVGHGLVRTLPPTRLTRIAFSVFLISASSVLLAGLFPMDFPGPPRTSSGRLHATGGPIRLSHNGGGGISILAEFSPRCVLEKGVSSIAGALDRYHRGVCSCGTLAIHSWLCRLRATRVVRPALPLDDRGWSSSDSFLACHRRAWASPAA